MRMLEGEAWLQASEGSPAPRAAAPHTSAGGWGGRGWSRVQESDCVRIGLFTAWLQEGISPLIQRPVWGSTSENPPGVQGKDGL